MQPAFRDIEVVQPLVDVGERLERDDVLAVQLEHVGERGFGRGEIAEIEVTPTQDDTRGDVVGMELQAGTQQVERPGDVPVLTMHFREGGEGQALGIFSVPPLELLDLARCHPDSGFRGLGAS